MQTTMTTASQRVSAKADHQFEGLKASTVDLQGITVGLLSSEGKPITFKTLKVPSLSKAVKTGASSGYLASIG